VQIIHEGEKMESATYMDSSSGWASTRSTFLLLLSPRRGGMKRGLGGRQYGAGEERIRPRETAQSRTAPAAGTIQIQAMA
jgi:hypothetical protein